MMENREKRIRKGSEEKELKEWNGLEISEIEEEGRRFERKEWMENEVKEYK